MTGVARALLAGVRPPYFSAAFGSGATTGTSNVAVATFPSFQVGNDSVTFTLPVPTARGTRTVSWKRELQHRSFNNVSTRTGGWPASFGGNSRTAVGWAAAGMASAQYLRWTNDTGPTPLVPTPTINS